MAFLRFDTTPAWSREQEQALTFTGFNGDNLVAENKGKELIGLPLKIVGTCYVDISAEERQIYDHMEGEAKGVV
ncbi:hypothetical protein HA466_0179170 [Hirschfeldia incana]|nr:hypothetical protein HA466_0179170 [Hirschfeldia incana]